MHLSDKISIILPCKNAADFIRECIDSIIHQSLTNWEVIAVDDHSSDDTFSILTEYSNRDDRITAVQNTGMGITPALCHGFSLSSGTCITRMDADDIMPSDKLGKFMDSLTGKRPWLFIDGLCKVLFNKYAQ